MTVVPFAVLMALLLSRPIGVGPGTPGTPGRSSMPREGAARPGGGGEVLARRVRAPHASLLPSETDSLHPRSQHGAQSTEHEARSAKRVACRTSCRMACFVLRASCCVRSERSRHVPSGREYLTVRRKGGERVGA